MFEFVALSSYAGAVAFGILSALLLVADQGHRTGRLLIAASLVTTVWFALSGAYYAGHEFGGSIGVLAFAEVLRDAFWFAFLGIVLLATHDAQSRRRVRAILSVGAVAVVIAAVASQLTAFTTPAELDTALARKASVIGFLGLAVFGLFLIEELVRATRRDERWAIKHLSLALGAIFAYDFYLYADALLFTRIHPDPWAARGLVNSFAVPLIAIAAARNRDWNLNIFVSRRVVFHSTVALGAGLYLLLMSVAGYYFNSYGGTWGGALRAAFVFGALLFLAVLIFSSQMRSRLRVLLAKHFYKNRYEYGEVWLAFTRKLSTSNADPDQLKLTILRAIADIMDSTGGILWSRTDGGEFVVSAAWSLDGHPGWVLAGDHPFVCALEESGEAFELGHHAERAATPAPEFPWSDVLPRAWIAVPIVHGDELLAFIVLAEARANESLTWEDRDLLRTVGRQAASYLAFLRATEALAEARQFEAFNRLSAFLVHDLKNVVAQLSLVVRNAERHRANPEFIDDAFRTIGDAVQKINRMLASLRQDTPGHGAPVEMSSSMI